MSLIISPDNVERDSNLGSPKVDVRSQYHCTRKFGSGYLSRCFATTTRWTWLVPS